MVATQTFTGTLVVLHCYKCHCAFGITRDHYERADRSGESFYCPNGHSQVFTKTREQELERELADTKRRLGWAESGRQAARDQANAAERSARAYKGHLTRMRNKVANGVCPVPECRRHFDAIQAHIKTVHPDWAASHPEVLQQA